MVVYGKSTCAISRRALLSPSAWVDAAEERSALDALPDGEDLVTMLIEMGHGSDVQRAEIEMAREIEAAVQMSTLRSLRLQRGLSQRQLADALSTVQPRISRIESGAEEMGLAFASRLAAALNVDMNAIQAAVSAGVRHGC